MALAHKKYDLGAVDNALGHIKRIKEKAVSTRCDTATITQFKINVLLERKPEKSLKNKKVRK